MPTGVKPKATDDPRDFVVIPSDQVRVAPSDAEITDLLRAAARHHSDVGARATSDPSVALSVPAVDATFRATAVNDDVPAPEGTFGRGVRRAITALMLALGICAAALSWQTFGYAAKKALFTWAPKWAIAASLPLDKLGLGAESAPPDDPAQPAAPTQSASDGAAPASTAMATTPSSDPAQLLQSMARDLANANQEVETLKASIAELKASQQQVARELAKVSDRVAEQNAKAKIAAAPPRPAVPMHRPAPTVYSPTPTASSTAPTSAPPPVYRPASPYPTTQAAAPPVAQPYVPPPVSLQPQADGGAATAPRPPMPVQ
jgi:hypothetical protein